VEAVADTARLLEIQRDLAIALLPCRDLRQCLDLLLGCAMRLPGFDCGGIYLCDEATGGLNLVAHYGLSDAFVAQAADFSGNSPQVQLVRAGALVYVLRAELPPAIAQHLATEGLEVLALVPVLDRERMVAVLNVSSHRHSRIDQDSRVALESLVAQAEGAVALIREREVRQHTERQLRLAVEGANLGTWVGDLSARRFQASAQTRALHGITTEGPYSYKLIMASIHPADRAQVAEAFQQALASGGPFSCEYRTAAEGEGRWLASNARVFEDEEGRRLYGVVRDITGRKQELVALREDHDFLELRVAERTTELEAANATLRESEEKNRKLHESMMDAFVRVDMTGRIVECNGVYQKMLGYTHEELRRLTFVDITPEKWHPLENRLVAEQILPLGYSESYEKEYRRKDGTLLPVELRTFAVRAADGTPAAMWAIVRDITKRKQAEQALQRSESLLNSAQRMSKIGGFQWDIKQQTMFWTEEMYRLHDFVPGELVPGSPEHIARGVACYDPEDQPVIMEAFHRCATLGEPYDLEFPITTASGRRLWIRTGAHAEWDGERIVRVTGTFMDITEQKQAEAALRESHELLTRFIQVSPIYSFIKTVTPTESRVLHASENYQQMIGVPGSEMVGKTMAELFPAEIAAKIDADDLAVVTRGEMVTLDEDFSGRHYTSLKFPIFQGNRTLLGGYTIDDTERKQAERALQEWNTSLEQQVEVRTLKLNQSEARFRQLAEASFEGVAISEGSILLDCNSQLAKLHGYEPAEILGRPVSGLVAPESRALVAERLRVNNEQPYEFKALRKDGSTFPAEVRGRTGYWMGRELRVSALRDLSTVKQTAAKLQAQQAALEHAQQHALIAEISAGIVHQLGQPLSALGANLSALIKLHASDLQRCGTLVIIQDLAADVARMREIVSHLRKLVSPGPKTCAMTDFNAIVAGVLPLLQQRADRHRCRLAVESEHAVALVHGDAVQLSQVILNLVSNALEASAECPLERRLVTITTRTLTEKGFEFSVRDAGAGLSPEAMRRMFSPFFSTKPDGLGIGLRLSQTIVQAHGGSIAGCNNADGLGATFRVTLPAHAPRCES
jgi:PAS domain S-box-containing protein